MWLIGFLASWVELRLVSADCEVLGGKLGEKAGKGEREGRGWEGRERQRKVGEK